MLKDQRKVFLPINNALSDVGHVYGFLQELGQVVQHIASRVEDFIGLCRGETIIGRLLGMSVLARAACRFVRLLSSFSSYHAARSRIIVGREGQFIGGCDGRV